MPAIQRTATPADLEMLAANGLLTPVRLELYSPATWEERSYDSKIALWASDADAPLETPRPYNP